MSSEATLRAALADSMRLNGDPRRKGDPPMDQQRIINVLGGIVMGVFGWWCNNIWQTVQSQQQQITQLNVELAKNYVPRVELQQSFDRIFSKLDAIDQQTKAKHQ
jgi:hypothetical protein